MDKGIKIAPCGLVCSECEAYKATQANDVKKLEEVANKWRQCRGGQDILPEFLPCDGCMTDGGRKTCFCSNACVLRPCVIEHQVTSCAVCPEFDGCKRLKDFLGTCPKEQAGLMVKLLSAIRDMGRKMF